MLHLIGNEHFLNDEWILKDEKGFLRFFLIAMLLSEKKLRKPLHILKSVVIDDKK